MKKNPLAVAQATAMYSEGKTHREIAQHFGISQTTVRQWIDPEYFREHKDRIIRWQKEHKDLVNAYSKERRKGFTQEQRDRHAAKQRQRYINDPKWRENLRRLAIKHRRTEQGYLAGKVRRMTIGHSDRHCPTHQKAMTAITGLTREEFAKRFGGDGHFDHIIPIKAFDLTDPFHLVRCLHPSNLRIVSPRENMLKGPKYDQSIDILSLPWVGTEDAIVQAETFISSQLLRLERLRAKDSRLTAGENGESFGHDVPADHIAQTEDFGAKPIGEP